MPRASHLRRQLSSVGTKLCAATLLVLGWVPALGYFAVSRHERSSLLAAKEDAAAMVARLFAAGLAAPLTFMDDKGAQEQASLLMANDEVIYGAVWSVDGDDPSRSLRKLGEVRRRAVTLEPPGDASSVLRTERVRDMVIVQSPVTDADHKVVGIALVAFSLDKENRAIEEVERRTLVGAAGLGLAVAALILALTQHLIVRRLGGLADAAKRFEDGAPVDLDVSGADEVGSLSRAFSAMMESIASRERRIEHRNRDMRRVLDNVAEGFFTVDRAGIMSAERSRVVDVWFGPPDESLRFADYIERIAPALAAWIKVGWASLDDEFMPLEVVLDQMSRRLERDGRFFDLEFRAIEDDEAQGPILVVVRDVTESVERERAEQAQREAIAIFRAIVGDRAGFDEFFAEASALVHEITDLDATDAARLVRAIHTLKGNAGTFEIESVVRVCHDVEQRILEQGGVPGAEDRGRIDAAWASVRQLREQLGGGGSPGDRIELHREDYDRLLADLEAPRGVDVHAIASTVRSFQHERGEARLARVAEQLRSIGRRLGKPDIEVDVQVSPSDLRLPADRWAGFWSVFAHVLRNTVDHGLERPDERASAGKNAAGHVGLALTLRGDQLDLSVSDDGRGIAWEKLRARASALGLPCAASAEVEELLYADAVSSRDVVTETSGRGVGMGAVRALVRASGGSIGVESVAGAGTTFHFRFPASTHCASAARAVANREAA